MAARNRRSPTAPSSRKATPRGSRDASSDLPSHFTSYGQSILDAEAQTLSALRLDEAFAAAVEAILACEGQVVVMGIGKPGIIAQKISATFVSTGTASVYLHPADAAHGDLGRIRSNDVVIALSNSGESDEIIRLLPAVRRIGARIIAITRDRDNTLARDADAVLSLGAIEEAGPMGLAPTASTLCMLAVGDALAMTALQNRPFDSETYALFHPGGKLGRSLMRVREIMRSGEQNPVVQATAPLSEAVAVMTRTPGRPGATHVVDKAGKLVGVFTDGDLRRLVERGPIDFTAAVQKVMAKSPRTVRPEDLVEQAARLMQDAGIDQVPVILKGKPVGLLDVQDLLKHRFL